MDTSKRYCRLQVSKKKAKRRDMFIQKQNETSEEQNVHEDKNSTKYKVDRFIEDVKRYAEKARKLKEKQALELEKRNISDTKLNLNVPNKKGLFENAVISSSFQIRGNNSAEERKNGLARLRGDINSLAAHSLDLGNSSNNNNHEIDCQKKSSSEDSFIEAHSKIVEKIIKGNDSVDKPTDTNKDEVTVPQTQVTNHEEHAEQSENSNTQTRNLDAIINIDKVGDTPDYMVVKSNEWKSVDSVRGGVHGGRHCHDATSHRDAVEGKFIKRPIANRQGILNQNKIHLIPNNTSVTNENDKRNKYNCTSAIRDVLTKHYNLPKFTYPLEYLILHNEFCQLEMKKLSKKLKQFGEIRGHINYSGMMKKVMREIIKKRMEDASPPPESSKLGSEASFLYKSVFPHGLRNYFYCNQHRDNSHRDQQGPFGFHGNGSRNTSEIKNFIIPGDSNNRSKQSDIARSSAADLENSKDPFVPEFYSNCGEQLQNSSGVVFSPDMAEQFQRIFSVNEQLNNSEFNRNKRTVKRPSPQPVHDYEDMFQNIFSPLTFSQTPSVKNKTYPFKISRPLTQPTDIIQNCINPSESLFLNGQNHSPMGLSRPRHWLDSLIPTPRRVFSPVINLTSSLECDLPWAKANSPNFHDRVKRRRLSVTESPITFQNHMSNTINLITPLRNNIKLTSPVIYSYSPMRLGQSYFNNPRIPEQWIPQGRNQFSNINLSADIDSNLPEVTNRFELISPSSTYLSSDNIVTPFHSPHLRREGMQFNNIETNLQPTMLQQPKQIFKIPQTPIGRKRFCHLKNQSLCASPLTFMEFKDYEFPVKPSLQMPQKDHAIGVSNQLPRFNGMPLFSPHNF